MFKRYSVCVAMFVALCFAGLAQAQEKKDDATGTWKWSMPGRNGGAAREITLKLKQDGEKLTGTVATPSGDLPLSDGKVVGDKISFFVQADMGGTPVKFISSGVVKGDEITIATKTDGGEDYGSMVLKRVK